MVYCGPPSKACIACRRRKIGCDQNPRGCRQCARSRKPCPGYRDYIDCLFKDQTQWARRKVVAASNRSQYIPDTPNGDRPVKNDTPPAIGGDGRSIAAGKVRRSGSTSRCTSRDRDPVDMPHALALVPSIPAKLQDLGTTVFFRLYAQFRHADDSGVPCPAFFDYAGTVLSDDSANRIVSTCIEAVGLASVANMQQDTHIMARARRGYIAALRGVHNALRIPSEASNDTTLLAVMLLNLFEHINCSDSGFLDVWTQHVNGAALLVQLRGTQQLTYQTGLQLFEQFCQTLTSNCIQNGIPVPQHIVDLREQCAQYLDTKSIFWQISDATIKVAQLRSMVVLKRIDDPAQVLRKALDIDQELKVIEARLWIEMPYTTCSDSLDPRFHRGNYHLYPDVGALHAWNSLRTGRCLLHQLIRAQMLKGFSSIPPLFLTSYCTGLFETSLGTLLQAIDDILCSAPQPLGWTQGSPSTPKGSEQASKSTIAGSKLLIWPFYVVIHIGIKIGLFDHVNGIDGCMINVLEDAGRQTGILAATLLAKLLRQNQLRARFPDIIQNGFDMGELGSP